MIRSFCTTLVALCTIGALNSCGEKAEEQPKQDSTIVRREHPVENVHMEPTRAPGGGEQFKVEYTAHAMDSLFAMPDAKQLRTPESAAQYNLTMPPKMTVIPHMIPAKDIKVIDRTDTTATVAFTPMHSMMTGRMDLRRVGKGNDSLWLVEKVTSVPPMP